MESTSNKRWGISLWLISGSINTTLYVTVGPAMSCMWRLHTEVDEFVPRTVPAEHRASFMLDFYYILLIMLLQFSQFLPLCPPLLPSTHVWFLKTIFFLYWEATMVFTVWVSIFVCWGLVTPHGMGQSPGPLAYHTKFFLIRPQVISSRLIQTPLKTLKPLVISQWTLASISPSFGLFFV